MLDFFKRDKNKIAKEGDDHTVDSKELLGENESNRKRSQNETIPSSASKDWTRGKILLSIFK